MAYKVLVVDDEESLLLLMQTNLEFLGYNVVTAADGVEAMEKVAAEMPDLILLDVRMPRKTGWEVCREVKSNPATSRIAVIFLSAFGQPEDVEKGLSLGADQYINKSVTPGKIMKAVEEVLAKRNPSRESAP